MKFLYYLSCIGNPNFNIKKDILYHNLIYIFLHNLKCNFDIIINLYEVDDIYYKELENMIDSLKFIDNKYIYVKKGILSEVFLTNPYNKNINNYDYILYIFDDVKLINFNLNDMIDIKKRFNLELISPKITNSTHKNWNSLSGNILSINNFLEIYCFLMTPKNVEKFFSLHSIENKWCWGIDLMFGYFNIKVGTYYKYVANHCLPSKCNHKEANDGLVKYLQQYNLTPKIITTGNYLKEKITLE